MYTLSPLPAQEAIASLKGLFKGKGQLLTLAETCIGQRDELMLHDMPRLLERAHVSPLHLLPVQLSRHGSQAGTCFLRWRRVDRSAMGTATWQAQLLAGHTPDALVPTLHRLEQQRLLFNAKISLLHAIAQLAQSTASKLDVAERTYQKRLSAIVSEAQ
ncbi:Protein of unknown function [Pseudomonas cedrina]|uniref:Integrase n=2 Tax=Pseudomonas cedrina TaxID=651740 RepID=A0A1V2K0M6_PSECE|nr:DUF3158 family protein [Pseudomonas cedrina]ONH50915.1 hypothetical protein BLL36_23685 [Pseudomonas cedrina subsp. cedrina]SDS63381.1 Protein of unknown function [Pseudomonas cedrina]